MNIENLKTLHDLLVADANNRRGMKFDLNILSDYDGTRSWWELFTFQSSSVKLNCNTTGCAMGLAAMSKAFPELTYLVDETNQFRVVYQGYRSTYIHAGAKLFDIDPATAAVLFTPDAYPAKLREGAAAELECARRVKELIDDGRFNREKLTYHVDLVTPDSYWQEPVIA